MDVRTGHFHGRLSGGRLSLLLDEAFAPCTFRCRFCTRSLRPEGTPPTPAPAMVAAIVGEFDALVAKTRPAEVSLASDDILAFPGVLDLVLACRRRGVGIELMSTGVRLVDPNLVAGLAAGGATLQLTLLSTRDETYARMTGVADAREQVERAIRAAWAAGIPTRLGVTLTGENVHELDEMLRFAAGLGAPEFMVRCFYPDAISAPEAWFHQHVDPRAVFAAIKRALEAGVVLPTLQLHDLPLCQADEEVVRATPIQILPHVNDITSHAWAPCAGCVARGRCSGMDPTYVKDIAPVVPPEGKVAALVEWLEERWRPREPGVDLAVPGDDKASHALWRRVVLDGEPVVVGIEPAGHGGGFFKSASFTAYYRGEFSAPHLADAFRAALRLELRSLRGAPEPVEEPVLVATLERVCAAVKTAAERGPPDDPPPQG